MRRIGMNQQLLEKIREWTEETALKYCKDCQDTCCNGHKHKILIEESELGPFLERDVPVFRLDELNKEEIPKPALIQISKTSFILYVDKYCPFYSKEKGCGIPENPRRPEVCREYPVFVSESLLVEFKSSCNQFNRREVREDFRRKFSGLKLYAEENSK